MVYISNKLILYFFCVFYRIFFKIRIETINRFLKSITIDSIITDFIDRF